MKMKKLANIFSRGKKVETKSEKIEKKIKKADKKQITGKEKIADLMGNENVVEVLFENGVMCMGCHAAPFETLEQGLMAHGMNKKQIEKIIKKINGEK